VAIAATKVEPLLLKSEINASPMVQASAQYRHFRQEGSAHDAGGARPMASKSNALSPPGEPVGSPLPALMRYSVPNAFNLKKAPPSNPDEGKAAGALAGPFRCRKADFSWNATLKSSPVFRQPLAMCAIIFQVSGQELKRTSCYEMDTG